MSPRRVAAACRLVCTDLYVLVGRLREVRLFSTFNITLGIEMLTTKKKIKLFVFFCILAWFPFRWCYWFVVGVDFLPCTLPLLFLLSIRTTIGFLPHWRTDYRYIQERMSLVQHELKNDEQIDWELELRTFLCNSQIYKCLSEAEEYRFKDLWI